MYLLSLYSFDYHADVHVTNDIAAQLLQKLSITAVGKREKLLNVVKNPVTRYLPVGARKVGEFIFLSINMFRYKLDMLIDVFEYLGLSFSAEKSVNLFDYVAKSSDDEPLVFVVSKSCDTVIKLNSFDLLIFVPNPVLSARYFRLVPWPMERSTRNTQMITSKVSSDLLKQ